MKCKDCKHWMTEYYATGITRESKFLVQVGENKQGEPVGKCQRIPFYSFEWSENGNGETVDTLTDLATTVDGSSYMADLITDGEFGCVLFETGKWKTGK